MATTFTELQRFLDDAGLTYDVNDEHAVIAIGFGCEPDDTTYRDADGDPYVQVLVRLVEKGEFVTVFVPRAWNLAECTNQQAVCEVVTRVQSKLKLVRYDFEDDGYLQPNIEIPLERAPMCAEQLHRAIAGVLLAVRQFDSVIRHAMETGEVDLERANNDPLEPPEISQLLNLADNAGGIDAVERLLGDDEAPPIEP